MLPTAALPLLLAVQSPAAEPIPVLLVSGANNHDWEWTTPSLRGMLEASGRFAVDVTMEPAVALADADALAKYRAFVLDYNGPRWGEAAEEAFLAAVRDGTGVAVIHAANNAFPGWTEYETLVGHLWREGTGHGSFHAFNVEIEDRDHPITRGLPDLLAHPDELYHDLVHMHAAEMRVLASALSSTQSGGTGEREPMVIVSQFGEGRMFHTPLGHVWRNADATRASHTDAQFQNLVVRGVEWAATGRVSDGDPRPNRLSSLERAAGWRLLFDGLSLAGWQRYRDGAPVEGWTVTDGWLRHPRGAKAGDIVASAPVRDFELELEWKAQAGANGGIKYRVPESTGSAAMLGPEYQVLDDARHGDGQRGNTSAGSLYALYEPAEGKELAPAGAVNTTRIVAVGDELEHWLNGRRLVKCTVGSEDWEARRAASKFKGVEGFAVAAAGHVGLQDHGDDVWYRSIKLRDHGALPGEAVELFPGEELAGWTNTGDALYRFEDGALVGESSEKGRHSFLMSEREFGDFLFEIDVRTEKPGNSGIQVRSHRRENGAVYGYQIEIDPSPRAWSGGLYEEGRRGWLQSLEGNDAARAAFRHGEWNRYRIECVGPWIRTWVNGVPCVDYVDPVDLSGFIALQVHGGKNTFVRWRNPELRDLGTRSWRPAGFQELGPQVVLSPSDFEDVALRTTFTVDDGGANLIVRVRDTKPTSSLTLRTDERAPGVHSWEGGWFVDLGDEAFAAFLKEGENRLAVCNFGARLTVHLNDRLAADYRGVDGEAGRVVLHTRGGAPLAIGEVEVLGEAE